VHRSVYEYRRVCIAVCAHAYKHRKQGGGEMPLPSNKNAGHLRPYDQLSFASNVSPSHLFNLLESVTIDNIFIK